MCDEHYEDEEGADATARGSDTRPLPPAISVHATFLLTA